MCTGVRATAPRAGGLLTAWCWRCAQVDAPSHRELARKVAEEGITLLKNTGGRLPLLGLGKGIKTVAVVGPNADNAHSHLGLYVATRNGVIIIFGVGLFLTLLGSPHVRPMRALNTCTHSHLGLCVIAENRARFGRTFFLVSNGTHARGTQQNRTGRPPLMIYRTARC